MCGRYSLTKSINEIARHFRLKVANLELTPRFNVAPTQVLPVVVGGPSDLELRPMRWGLVPSWAKEESVGNRMINARAETVAEKPSFRSSFKTKRCLVPCDGFYEWVPGGDGKTPHYIRMKTGDLFAFAGLWAKWEKDGSTLFSYTIITTQASSFLKPLHDRMPVVLLSEQYDAWMQTETTADTLHALLHPLEEDLLEFFPVSKAVNSPKNDSPGLLTPAE